MLTGRACYHSAAVEKGCLLAVNSDDDPDTTGAIYRQIAKPIMEMNSYASWKRYLVKICRRAATPQPRLARRIRRGR
jgi:hypothetical protein